MLCFLCFTCTKNISPKKKKKPLLQECSVIINYMTLNMLLNAYISNCEYYRLGLNLVSSDIVPDEMMTFGHVSLSNRVKYSQYSEPKPSPILYLYIHVISLYCLKRKLIVQFSFKKIDLSILMNFLEYFCKIFFIKILIELAIQLTIERVT